MPRKRVKRLLIRQWLTGAVVAAALVAPIAVSAQVVVIANGSPITELDIQQRTKLIAAGDQKAPARQDVVNELIDDRLKIAKAKVYGLEATDEEVETSFNNVAQRQHLTPQQFGQVLDRSGISAGGFKARLRAQIVWGQLIRGKFVQSLQVGDNDVTDALKARNETDNTAVGYLYTLYPVTLVVARGSSEAVIGGKRQEAENLRSRFTACNEGLAMARGLRDIAVRDPINRSSADLAPQLRDMLNSTQVGHLTAPEVTAQGLQMFALCNKKESSAESSVKREVREQLFNKRFEAESKKFLDEIRKAAMIERK